MDISVIAKNVKRIRLAASMTQAGVAKTAAISLATYGKLESGRTVPRVDTLHKVAEALGTEIRDLLSPVKPLNSVRFRAQKRLKRRDHILARASGWLEDFNDLQEMLEYKVHSPLGRISRKILKQKTNRDPKLAAQLIRKEFALDDSAPIHDITGLLASQGVKVLTYNLASEGLFGMSIAEADGGPAIVINVWERIPVERWIFSAAHELGHLVLHSDAYDVNLAEENDREEEEANEFASYFLMPHTGFQREWSETSGLPFLNRILKVKRIFRVSYKAVLLRLIDLGWADENVWKTAHWEIKNHYGGYVPRHFEPERLNSADFFEPEKLNPSDFVEDWLSRLVRLALEKELITVNRGSEILDIPFTEMKSRVVSWVKEQGLR